MQETSIPYQPLSQSNALINSHSIPPDSCHNIDLQYYVQDKSRDEHMSKFLPFAKREAGARNRLDVDLEFESEYGEGSCT
jgi:hypothetical protein